MPGGLISIPGCPGGDVSLFGSLGISGLVLQATRTAANRDDRPGLSTLLADDGLERARRAQKLRWLGFAAVLLIVVAGALQLLGVRTATASAEGSDGTRLEVSYGRITRPGLATVWNVTVSNPAGFSEPLTITTTASYLAAFDENGLTPEPQAIDADGDVVSMRFDPPAGTTLEVSFDARIEPGVQWGRGAVTTLDVGGTQVASVSYYTWILP